MKWPDEVPMLTADDMCKGRAKRGDRCCLLGHINRVVTGSALMEKPCGLTVSIRGAIQVEVNALDIVTYNDSHKLADNARRWNRAMARLGYVVGNPECKRNGELKPW